VIKEEKIDANALKNVLTERKNKKIMQKIEKFLKNQQLL